MGAKHDRKLVDTIARGLIAAHKITLEPDLPQRLKIFVNGVCPDRCGQGSPSDLFTKVGGQVGAKVKRLKPETLGRIACTGLVGRSFPGGRTTLREVHCGPYLDQDGSGREHIITIATTAIIARMWDILQEELWARARPVAAAGPISG